ncbi:MAG TPA: peptidoglycan recognition family protein, partial [Phycisphaerae bacterium]|nr:peptidoglycan recognition family protein [Phycisphaerae bacterium]
RLTGLLLLLPLSLGLLAGCDGEISADKQEVAYLPYYELPSAHVTNASFVQTLASHHVTAVKPNHIAKHSTSSASPWYVNGNRPWKYIVIHHSASPSGNSEKFLAMHLARGWDEMGYHFVITNGNGGPDGAVEIGSRWLKQKWGAHTGGTPGNEYNNFGIGVCLVGNFDETRPTPAQLHSLEQLVRFLVKTYNIDTDNIIAHKDAPNAHTRCCGQSLYTYIHSQEFKQKVAK